MTSFPNTDLEPYDIWTRTEDPMDTPDEVNQPAHYKQGGIETIDVLQAKLSPAEFEGFCIGNALKYLTRRHYKGKAQQDLEKAHWYLTKALATQRDTADPTGLDLVTAPPVEELDEFLEEVKPLLVDYLIRGAPLITKYPAGGHGCIQPGCSELRADGRVFCEDHILSKGGGNGK